MISAGTVDTATFYTFVSSSGTYTFLIPEEISDGAIKRAYSKSVFIGNIAIHAEMIL